MMSISLMCQMPSFRQLYPVCFCYRSNYFVWPPVAEGGVSRCQKISRNTQVAMLAIYIFRQGRDVGVVSSAERMWYSLRCLMWLAETKKPLRCLIWLTEQKQRSLEMPDMADRNKESDSQSLQPDVGLVASELSWQSRVHSSSGADLLALCPSIPWQDAHAVVTIMYSWLGVTND